MLGALRVEVLLVEEILFPCPYTTHTQYDLDLGSLEGLTSRLHTESGLFLQSLQKPLK